MTLKLNQVIALEKGAKGTAVAATTDAYHQIQKAPLFAGQERVYQPKDDDGDTFPPEPVKLQLRVEDVLTKLAPFLERFWDLTITKDAANQAATANIVVDGEILATQVPVTSLLFLEKQLADINTLISKLPVLDPAETWEQRDGAWRSVPVLTTKTKKVPRTFVKAPATDKHPAQVDVFTEDAIIGTWNTTKLSGAIPTSTKQELIARVQKLQAAVKVAREEANVTEAPDVRISAALLGYLGIA